MVILVERLSKFYSKLENHHHQQQSEALMASLQAFRSDVSNCINQLCLNSKPGSEILSLSWIQQCFQLLPMINKAFAKLVVDIDYHMSKWKAKSIEEYLKYSFDLLDLLNFISSSLSHLGQTRLLLSHALSLVESSPSSAIEHLKAIKFKSSSQDFKVQENKEDEKETYCSDQEWVICQALRELKSVGFWVCYIALAGLCGDAKAYLEMRKSFGMVSNSPLIDLDSSICGVIVEKRAVLKDVEELNDAAACLAAAIAIEKCDNEAEELKRRLKVFENLLDGLRNEVDHLFSKVLAGRNELLDGIRHRKQ